MKKFSVILFIIKTENGDNTTHKMKLSFESNNEPKGKKMDFIKETARTRRLVLN